MTRNDDEWMDDAACKDLGQEGDNIFFPEVLKGQRGDLAYRRAKGICKDCPVRTYCLSFAIAHSVPGGVWGGLTPNERRRIKKDVRVQIRRAWYNLHPHASRIRY